MARQPVMIMATGHALIGVGGGATDEGGFSARWVTNNVRGTDGELRQAWSFKEEGPLAGYGDQALVAVKRGDLFHEAYGTGPLSLSNPEATIASWQVLDIDRKRCELVLNPLFGFRGQLPESVVKGAGIVGNEDGALFVAPDRSDDEIQDELAEIMKQD